MASQEEQVWRIVQVSHAEKGDAVVLSGQVIVALCRVALRGVLDSFR